MSEAKAGLTCLVRIASRANAVTPALIAWNATLSKLDRPIQLLICDDSGSPEGDDEIAKGISIFRGPAVRVESIQNEKTLGFGACIRDALSRATEPLFFYTSLDYPYDPADIVPMIERIEKTDEETGLQLHLVNGYRSLTPIPAWNRFWSGLRDGILRVLVNVQREPLPGWLGKSQNRFWFWSRFYFGVRLGDLNSHFKLFRRSIFRRIPIQSAGEFVHAEILAKANFLGCYMDELPIAKKTGPFPASIEIPAIDAIVWKEMREVRRRPDFGPWPLPEETLMAPSPEIISS